MKKQLALLLLGFSVSLNALDLGKQGTTYEIIEIDMRQLIMEGAAQINPEEVKKGMKNAANNYLKELPKYNLKEATEDKLQFVDLSMPHPQDVQVPVKQRDGSYKWQTVARKGELINPLDFYKMDVYLLVVDGRKKKDVAAAVKLSKKYNLRIQVVLTQGNPAEIAKEFDFPVFYYQPEMSDRFQVQAQPALLFQSKDALTKKYLAIQYYGNGLTEAKVEKTLKEIAEPVVGFKGK